MCQFFHDFLPIAAVFNAVKHPSKHARGVSNAFFFADLRAGGVEIHRVHAQICRCDLKCAAGAGAGLFKHQGDAFSLAQAVGNAGLFLPFEFGRHIQQSRDIRRRKVQQFEKTFLI